MFEGDEHQYLVDCIDSNFVSPVGAKVTEFEERITAFTGAGFAVATVNGTAALLAAGPIRLIPPLAGTRPNHWLNAVLLGSLAERDALLEVSNSQGVMTCPIWLLMNRLPMYKHCQHEGLVHSIWLEERVENLQGRLKL